MASGALEWARAAQRLIHAHGQIVLVTQCTVEGSAPREPGVRMLVSGDELWGTIGGGNLEYQLIKQARALLTTDAKNFLMQDYPLGPLLAQCCGGHVRVLLQWLGPDSLEALSQVEARAASGEAFWLETRFDAACAHTVAVSAAPEPVGEAIGGNAVFVGIDGEVLDGARPDRAAVSAMFERVDVARPQLFMFGAGHVGQAVAAAMAPTAFALTCYDEREAFRGEIDAPFQPLADIGQAVSAAPAGAYFLVFTHSHEQDYQLTRAILSRGDAAFCGLIGSKTKRARFVRRYGEDGLNEAQISQLTCPIGLPSLKSKQPATIAVGVAAQLLALEEARLSGK